MTLVWLQLTYATKCKVTPELHRSPTVPDQVNDSALKSHPHATARPGARPILHVISLPFCSCRNKGLTPARAALLHAAEGSRFRTRNAPARRHSKDGMHPPTARGRTGSPQGFVCARSQESEEASPTDEEEEEERLDEVRSRATRSLLSVAPRLVLRCVICALACVRRTCLLYTSPSPRDS